MTHNPNIKTRTNLAAWLIRMSVLASVYLAPGLHLQSQDLYTQLLAEQLDSLRINHSKEKLYLHTDRSFYIIGEMLWLKAYLLDAHLHQPSEQSKIVTIEITDAEGRNRWNSFISLTHGMGSGSFQIPASFQTGNYVLHAYTSGMHKGQGAFDFRKQITVINPRIPPPRAIPEKDSMICVSYPEGGRLIAGIPSRIGFAVTGIDRNGNQPRVYLLNRKGDTITSKVPGPGGLGLLECIPEAGEAYQVKIYPHTGHQNHQTIQVQNSGIALRADLRGKDSLLLKISTLGIPMPASCWLLIHCRQTNIRLEKIILNARETSYLIPLTEIGTGVNQISLLNAEGQTLSERLFYQPGEPKPSPSLATDQIVYEKRSPVNLTIQSTDAKAVVQHLSASVTRLDSFVSTHERDIRQVISLESDLAPTGGNLYFPAEILTDSKLTDLFLMTTPAQRFEWPSILNPKENEQVSITELNGIIQTGLVINKASRLPVSDVIAYATLPGLRPELRIARSDQNGILRFPLGYKAGTAELITQVHTIRDSAYKTEMQPRLTSGLVLARPMPLQLDSTQKEALEARIAHAQIEELFHSPYEELLDSLYARDTTAFYGKPDKIYPLDDYTRFATLEEVLREYVIEVEVRRSRNQFRLAVLNKPYNSFFDEDPLMLLDGVPVFDPNVLLKINPLDIRYIDVISRRYYLGGLSFPGILSLRTYEGNLGSFTLDPSAMVTDFTGVQTNRVFPSASQADARAKDSRIPDFRHLLWWEPHIRLDAGQTKVFKFYTSDIPGKYQIRLEGISEEGEPVSVTKYFEVK